MQPLPFLEWMGGKDFSPESSAAVRARVMEARSRALAREGETQETLNARLTPAMVRKVCLPDAAGLRLVESAVQKGRLSIRGLDRVLRVARTIADLEGASSVARAHVAEALFFRISEAVS
jgi:magnesium chelatase family protein